LYNDLERAAVSLKPALRRTLDAGRDAHALAAIVCGSGPTCAFLVDDEPAAIALVAALAGSGTCRTVRRAHGPVPGARVVT
ncbi:MAG TPA: 4-(cytidine 5'-diphospho)-2-C-methyl-D-erythritol kinase, partial [Acidothermaceae bacterium]